MQGIGLWAWGLRFSEGPGLGFGVGVWSFGIRVESVSGLGVEGLRKKIEWVYRRGVYAVCGFRKFIQGLGLLLVWDLQFRGVLNNATCSGFEGPLQS